MKNVKQKRRRGRPATGHTPVIALRLAADEIQIVDEIAAELGYDRSKAVRKLLRKGIAAYRRKQQRAKTKRRRIEAANREIVEDVLAGRYADEPESRAAPKRQPGYRR